MSLSGGDAAEQMVRILLSGVEMTVRLSGEGAKNLAALLYAWSQKQHDPAIQRQFGRTSMTKLLKSGQELRVFRMNRAEYERFRRPAKRFRLLFAALRNKRDPDALLDLVVRADEIPRVNHILESIGYGGPLPEKAAEKAPTAARPDSPGREPCAPKAAQPDEASKKSLRHGPPQAMSGPDRRPRTAPKPLVSGPRFEHNWRAFAARAPDPCTLRRSEALRAMRPGREGDRRHAQ